MNININHLQKKFDDKTVINDFSYSLDEKNVYGLVGRNGSGKTTLLKMLSGLLVPCRGEINCDKKNYQASYIDNNPRSFFLRVSCLENLYYFGAINNLSKIDVDNFIYEKFNGLGIEDFIRTPMNKISQGQNQLVAIARGLMTSPELVLYDEVFSSLDKTTLERLKNIFENYRAEKASIHIFSSHIDKILSQFTSEIIRL